MAAKVQRFAIVTPAGVEPVKLAGATPNAVLSKALALACRATEPGVWDVKEYDDVLYRVHRLPSETLDVRVEVAS